MRAVVQSAVSPDIGASRTGAGCMRKSFGRAGLLLWHSEEVPEHQYHADRDGGVGDVEYRPRSDIDEIGDVSLSEAIEEVSDGAA